MNPEILDENGEISFAKLKQRVLKRFSEDLEVQTINFPIALAKQDVNSDIKPTTLGDCYQMLVTFRRPLFHKKTELSNGDDHVETVFYPNK